VQNNKTTSIITILFTLTCLCFLGSLFVGPINVFSFLSDEKQMQVITTILTEIRLPRAFLAIIVGGSLGLSGAVLQGFLRNPLAESGILGISSGAALGAVLCISLGFSLNFPYLIPLSGMIGATITSILLYVTLKKHFHIYTVILIGVAINSLASSMTSVVLNLSKNPYATLEIIFWLLGSLEGRSLDHVKMCFPFIFIGWGILWHVRQSLDALSLGEETAKSLGYSVRSTYQKIIIGVALCVGASVSVSGIIGFVGLIVPHMLRLWVGQKPSDLLIPSALGGAFLVLLADIITRIPLWNAELKLGVVTALIGSPFFIHLIFKYRKAYA
jgi:iron complex transport system permease protein